MTPEKLEYRGAYTNTRDNRVQHGSWQGPDGFGGSRYDFDCDKEFRGWRQFDTDQDAPYFGFWTRKATRQTFTYCEGDTTFVTCPDDASYDAEVRNAIEVYTQGRICMVVERDGKATEFFEDQSLHLIAP